MASSILAVRVMAVPLHQNCGEECGRDRTVCFRRHSFMGEVDVPLFEDPQFGHIQGNILVLFIVVIDKELPAERDKQVRRSVPRILRRGSRVVTSG